jgi:hypothetical protein
VIGTLAAEFVIAEYERLVVVRVEMDPDAVKWSSPGVHRPLGTGVRAAPHLGLVPSLRSKE